MSRRKKVHTGHVSGIGSVRVDNGHAYIVAKLDHEPDRRIELDLAPHLIDILLERVQAARAEQARREYEEEHKELLMEIARQASRDTLMKLTQGARGRPEEG